MKRLILAIFLFLTVVVPCLINGDKLTCILPEGGIEYKVNESDFIIGFQVPFVPQDCAVKTDPTGFKPVPCDKVGEALGE